MDEQVRQDQEDEAAWDAWVESQKNQDADRGPPTLHVGGTTFTWSGHPESNVRAPPQPTEQEQAVQDLLEESERTTQEMIDNRKVAMAVQKIVEREIGKIRAVLDGTIDYGPDAIYRLKQDLDETRAADINAMHIYRAAYDACILETKSDPKYNEQRHQNVRTGGRIQARYYNVWKYWLAEPHCRNVGNAAAEGNVYRYREKLADLERQWEAAARWGTRFQTLIDALKAATQDEFITQREQKQIYALIEDASNLIEDAVRSGIKTNFAGIHMLNEAQLDACLLYTSDAADE